MYNVCDDKLLDMVGKELIRHGIIMPISEIENLAITAYDYTNNLPIDKITILFKKDAYYNSLKLLICMEALASLKLIKARNKYEAEAILMLLQGYLDEFANLHNLDKVNAYDTFIDAIKKLPFKLTPGHKPEEQDEICAACKCSGELWSTECAEYLTFSLHYKNLCLGVRINPEVFGNLSKISKNDLPEFEQKLEEVIDKVSDKLKQQVSNISISILEEHNK